MAKKRGFHAGAWDAFGFMGFTAEVARLVMAQRLKLSGEFKKLGYDKWEDFCDEQFRCSDETMNRKLKQLKEVGPHILSSCREIGMEWQEIKLLTMSDQKENVKKGFILVDGEKVLVNEDNADKVRLYVGNLEKEKELAEKEVKGIEKEHKHEVKAMQEELESLQSLMPKDEEDREWATRYIEDIDKAHEKFDRAMRAFAFGKKAFSDPVLQAKLLGKCEEVKRRFETFVIDVEMHISAENE